MQQSPRQPLAALIIVGWRTAGRTDGRQKDAQTDGWKGGRTRRRTDRCVTFWAVYVAVCRPSSPERRKRRRRRTTTERWKGRWSNRKATKEETGLDVIALEQRARDSDVHAVLHRIPHGAAGHLVTVVISPNVGEVDVEGLGRTDRRCCRRRGEGFLCNDDVLSGSPSANIRRSVMRSDRRLTTDA